MIHFLYVIAAEPRRGGFSLSFVLILILGLLILALIFALVLRLLSLIVALILFGLLIVLHFHALPEIFLVRLYR